MKLISYEAKGKKSWGAVVEGGIVDLAGRAKHYAGVDAVIAANAQAELAGLVEGARADLPLDGITYLPPVLDPDKILCVGVNYANRNEEYKDGEALPPYPSLFYRTMDSVVGHMQALERPPESEQLDYEGEIVLVIGKGGRRIPKENWQDAVAGMTIMNEGSVRDWLRHSKFNTTQGKNFHHSGSIGPWMVTMDELRSANEMRIVTRVNGEVRQDDTTRNMIFGFDYLINYISTFVTLKAGDLIVTGTPTGAGGRFTPPKWLKPGDDVEVMVPHIGTLRNGIIDEPV